MRSICKINYCIDFAKNIPISAHGLRFRVLTHDKHPG